MIELFRGQYYFGTSAQVAPDNFLTLEVSSGYTLHRHKELPTAIVFENDSYTILVGFCFDYLNPKASLQVICEKLQASSHSLLPDVTDSLAGRFVIIKSNPENTLVMSDAAGTLPICYHRSSEGVNIASSSRLIERMHPNRPENPLITEEFRALQATPGRHAGFFFPLNTTGYSDVFALLPNHSLDIANGKIKRFFPDNNRYGVESYKSMAPQIADVIKRIFIAASQHYELKLASTGGFDSLILQSAIAGIDQLSGKVDFFTFQYPHDPEGKSADIQNPRKSAQIIGATHRTIFATTDGAESQVEKTCRSSEEFYATGFEGWVEACDGMTNNNQLIIMGWASEIARGFYRWAGSEKVNTRELMDCAGFREMSQFYPVFEEWRSEALEAESRSHIRMLDLFYWENRVGRWCGPGLNVLNTGANWMTPFSCRGLMKKMLLVRERDRVGRRQRLYRELAHTLEPRLNSVTPNPMTAMESVSHVFNVEAKDMALSLAIRSGLDRYLRRSR